MSDVERFYYAVQKYLGGNIPWANIDGMHQSLFVQSINNIIHITSMKQDRPEDNSQ